MIAHTARRILSSRYVPLNQSASRRVARTGSGGRRSLAPRQAQVTSASAARPSSPIAAPMRPEMSAFVAAALRQQVMVVTRYDAVRRDDDVQSCHRDGTLDVVSAGTRVTGCAVNVLSARLSGRSVRARAGPGAVQDISPRFPCNGTLNGPPDLLSGSAREVGRPGCVPQLAIRSR